MIIRNKKTFSIGVVLLISFVAIYAFIMSPRFGDGRNGLQYSDDMFNSLSKGSAYFIKDQAGLVKAQQGKNIDVTLKASSPEDAAKWSKLYTGAGADVTIKDSSLAVKGDLGKILNAALADSESMYNNDGKALEAKYGYDGREATYNWYASFKNMDGALKKNEQFKEAAAVTKIQQKAIEPAYNYYGVEIKQVSDNKGSVSFMLIFYLIYTMWYGFGLFYLFDGLGITTSKGKKAESH